MVPRGSALSGTNNLDVWSVDVDGPWPPKLLNNRLRNARKAILRETATFSEQVQIAQPSPRHRVLLPGYCMREISIDQ